MKNINNIVNFFSNYQKINGVVEIEKFDKSDSALYGKRLGLLNGSSWISIWCSYFAKKYLPGVNVLQMGNDAIQYNFMQAYYNKEKCPPQRNIDIFVQNAKDLIELANVDAILITCSTMNRSYLEVKKEVKIPVVQIDLPMMEKAAQSSGKVLIIATHGPTIESSKALLYEIAAKKQKKIAYKGILVEKAWNFLSKGNIVKHNKIIASIINKEIKNDKITCVVLAQLSMSTFIFTYPDTQREFGIPIYNSGEVGFKYIAKVLKSKC